MEPELEELYQEAAAVTSENDPHFCANKIWYSEGGLKERLMVLVGWTRKKEGHHDLNSAEAYDLAYDKIYESLPDCRDCGCP